MVVKTNDEILCLKYYKKLIFTCFVYCANEGRVIENIESGVATLKIVTTMQKLQRRRE